MSDFANAFTFIGNNVHLLLTKTSALLLLSVEALIVAVVLAVPLGVILGHTHRFSFLAINISNFGRALPSLAVLAILLPFIGIGKTDVIIALFVLAFPPILTNTYVAIDQVDPDAVEAATGMGMRPRQVILRVEMPLALPLMFAGVRTSAVFVVATAPLAGFFGGGGLGDIIANRASYGLAGVLGASYVIIVLALIAQVLFIALERAVTPRGLRAERAQDDRPPIQEPPDRELVTLAA
jgi:osmoprotectant transport system permease protein